MKASLIIPSYNARERLKYNLIALNRQSYEGEDIEVIVIDNGSTDKTLEMLDGFELKYPLKKIRVEKNNGIAHGRNQGILEAEGDILIFHDSDMIASKDYIKLHLEAHREPNIVACGLFWRRIFTFYYKGFHSSQMATFDRICSTWALDKKAYPDGYPLITEEEVASEDLNTYGFDLDFGFINDLKATILEYGKNLVGYYLPWRFCITNNLSVDREKVIEVGMFDDKIIRYGYEDYDLGIRLFKAGCHFTMAEHIVSLHQEHPANFHSGDLEANVKYMCEKYNSIYFIDMPLVCLSDHLNIDKTRMNAIMKDINQILTRKEYHPLLELFLHLLQVIRVRLYNPQEDNSRTIFPKIAENLKTTVRSTLELWRKERTVAFISELASLLKLTYNIDFNAILKANI